MSTMKYVMILTVVCTAGLSLEAHAGPLVGITVAPGDTLRTLCRQHLENPDSCREIYRLNHMRNPDLIRPGQRVMVPAELLRGIPAEGVVSFVTGEVRYYRAAGEEGRPPQVGESLEEGGRLETGGDGTVEVTFGDGSSFLLKPDSVLSLVRSRQKGDEFVLRNLFLKTGRVLSRIRKATGHEQRYNIRTPSAVAGARGTEFRVSVDEEETTRSEVLAGTVAVEAMRREVMLHEGEGTGVRKGEIPAPPRPLLPPPRPLGVSPVYKSEPVRIGFSTVAGANALRATLARDGEMRAVVRERVMPVGEAFEVSGLDDGSYFLQATSIDEKGLEGKPLAPVPVVIRLNPMPPNVEAPREGAEYRSTTVTARWLRVGGATGYRIQIDGDHSFTSPLVDQRVEGVEQKVELGYGSYHFRVASVAPDGFQGEWSDALSFSLVKPPPTPAPAGAPEDDGKQMRIRVRDAGKGITYRFQVARDEQFADLLQDTKVEVPELVIPRPDAGTYYVRTLCIDAKGNEGSFSPPQSFVIERRFPYGMLGVAGGIVGLIIGLVL
ncbi:FecR domain-containing protein [Geobacter hydrogenophilus]|uniref:LysM domain-containing protein n=1 Tax=Geobacter hydrogenophilus TaxID=40983 RepID=A0A9W6FY80_9BACT|nr:FecR domain-containing protein [Geobacter hydrogenophilus]MBT0894943.1 FecR domain-containing protein [Geobacter hydrogenophilus]GLI37086.1 hypothetical protein GHYDROH2_05870 [Geobacter hydrogenophilus]